MFSLKAKVKMGDFEFYYEGDAQTLLELYTKFMQETKLQVEQQIEKELNE